MRSQRNICFIAHIVALLVVLDTAQAQLTQAIGAKIKNRTSFNIQSCVLDTSTDDARIWRFTESKMKHPNAMSYVIYYTADYSQEPSKVYPLMVEEVVSQESENLLGGVSSEKQTNPYFKFEDATYAALKEYINAQRTYAPKQVSDASSRRMGKTARPLHDPDQTNRDQLVYMKINNNHFLAKQINRPRPPVQVAASMYAQSAPAPGTPAVSASSALTTGSGPSPSGTATLAKEPTNGIFNALVDSVSSTFMHVVWYDSTTGANVPEGYLLLASRTDNFILPVNGVSVQDNMNPSRGQAAVNVPYSSARRQTAAFHRLSPSTRYYLQIVPYIGSDSSIAYNVRKPRLIEATTAAPAPLQDTVNNYMDLSITHAPALLTSLSFSLTELSWKALGLKGFGLELSQGEDRILNMLPIQTPYLSAGARFLLDITSANALAMDSSFFLDTKLLFRLPINDLSWIRGNKYNSSKSIMDLDLPKINIGSGIIVDLTTSKIPLPYADIQEVGKLPVLNFYGSFGFNDFTDPAIITHESAGNIAYYSQNQWELSTSFFLKASTNGENRFKIDIGAGGYDLLRSTLDATNRMISKQQVIAMGDVQVLLGLNFTHNSNNTGYGCSVRFFDNRVNSTLWMKVYKFSNDDEIRIEGKFISSPVGRTQRPWESYGGNLVQLRYRTGF